jgi:hypothetical protein
VGQSRVKADHQQEHTVSTQTSITEQLRQRLAASLPQATPEQVDELMTMASNAGAAINRTRSTSDSPEGAVHYLTWPTSATYLCGADAVGRRSTQRDTDHWNTTCTGCLNHKVHPFAQEAAVEANDP